jgi:hypothetical protein
MLDLNRDAEVFGLRLKAVGRWTSADIDDYGLLVYRYTEIAIYTSCLQMTITSEPYRYFGL